MAERRMFAKTIIDSDAFLDMPLTTQALYFHLGMRADDDGFVNNAKKIQRMIGADEDDLKLLVDNGFVISFESNVVVIKHWRVHNYIKNDRYKRTVYTDEKNLLGVKENKVYTLGNDRVADASEMEPDCIQDVSKTDTQLGKGNKDIVNQDIVNQNRTQTFPKMYGKNSNIPLMDYEFENLCDKYDKDVLFVALNKMSDYIINTDKEYFDYYDRLCKWIEQDISESKAKDCKKKIADIKKQVSIN